MLLDFNYIWIAAYTDMRKNMNGIHYMGILLKT